MIIVGEKNMIGKIVSIKNGIVYVQLSINIYETDSLIGKNVTFADRYIGEITNMSNTVMEVNLIGEIINNVFIPGNLTMPPFNSDCRLTTKEEIDKTAAALRELLPMLRKFKRK